MCNFSIHLDRSNTVDHEFIEQCKWFGLSSAVYSCLFLMCATDIHTYIYTVSQKKQDTKLLPITSPNVNRFSKFFHWLTHW